MCSLPHVPELTSDLPMCRDKQHYLKMYWILYEDISSLMKGESCPNKCSFDNARVVVRTSPLHYNG